MIFDGEDTLCIATYTTQYACYQMASLQGNCSAACRLTVTYGN